MAEKLEKISVHRLFMELLLKFFKDDEIRLSFWDILMCLRRVEIPQEIQAELAEFLISNFFKDFEINDRDFGATYLEQFALIVVDWEACDILGKAIKDEKFTKREILNLTAIQILCLEITCPDEKDKIKLLQKIVSYVLAEPPEFYIEDGYNECLRIVEKLDAIELIQTLVDFDSITSAEQKKWQEFQGYLAEINCKKKEA